MFSKNFFNTSFLFPKGKRESKRKGTVKELFVNKRSKTVETADIPDENLSYFSTDGSVKNLPDDVGSENLVRYGNTERIRGILSDAEVVIFLYLCKDVHKPGRLLICEGEIQKYRRFRFEPLY